MGRRPSKPGSIARLRERKKASGRVFYYYEIGGKDRKEIALGSDYGLAIMEYAKLERDRTATALVAKVITFRYVAEKYMIDVVPTKKPATQKDNIRELKNLMSFFDDPPAPLETIQPLHVRQYLTWRKAAPVRANREKALLSAIWNFARDVGYTALANPCAGIKGNKETGRDIYIEDALFKRVYEKADSGLQDAMDLAYLTGQRVTDTRLMDERDVRDGQIWVLQGKTNAKRRIEITGELKILIDRIMYRKSEHKVRSTRLIVTEDGTPMSVAMLRGRFDLAREAAGVAKSEFQMRDLRAKAGTDKAESSGDILQARDQLGHTTVVMTEQYIRNRIGKKVSPTK
ncbi:integrase [Pseudomonas sp. B1(2018)]|uniref:tyrosine-type recombinase/integrase n=1 Tax=Pseudomonas sp. B1(2018) TaxID=2233856 RepID=UPI000D5C3D28|nr:tyrosine-type recombinase/integrase [Pseudomonas sp. B1(2018)]PVZ59275.1 integrase [Pseudomonas sp. B1(2018)]